MATCLTARKVDNFKSALDIIFVTYKVKDSHHRHVCDCRYANNVSNYLPLLSVSIQNFTRLSPAAHHAKVFAQSPC